MKVLRTLLIGGACGLGVLSYSAIADIGNAASAVKEHGGDLQLTRVADNSPAPAWAAEATMNPDYVKGGETKVADDSSKATTSYFGGEAAPANPAWAAPATMNPDYQNSESPAPASTASEAPSPAAASDKATTTYFGDKASTGEPAWAAEATMNPDYQKGESTSEPEAAANNETPPPATGGQATTTYFGGKTAPANPPWDAEATMNPDYNTAASPPSAPAQPSTAATEPAAAPVRNEAMESCREALTAEAGSMKLYFPGSSYDIPSASRSALKKVAKIIGGCGNVVVEVGGFTDNTGKAESNQKLSELRAKAVVNFLTSAGVDASKLKAVGYGQTRPITTNKTAEGRRLNRRIAFSVSSG